MNNPNYKNLKNSKFLLKIRFSEIKIKQLRCKVSTALYIKYKHITQVICIQLLSLVFKLLVIACPPSFTEQHFEPT